MGKPKQRSKDVAVAVDNGDIASERDHTASFRLSSPWAESVMLVGEFNDWSTTSTPMQRVPDTDEFVADVIVEPGRRYRYKFLVDGERWENDPLADDYVANEYGGHDSVRQC